MMLQFNLKLVKRKEMVRFTAH